MGEWLRGHSPFSLALGCPPDLGIEAGQRLQAFRCGDRVASRRTKKSIGKSDGALASGQVVVADDLRAADDGAMVVAIDLQRQRRQRVGRHLPLAESVAAKPSATGKCSSRCVMTPRCAAGDDCAPCPRHVSWCAGAQSRPAKRAMIT